MEDISPHTIDIEFDKVLEGLFGWWLLRFDRCDLKGVWRGSLLFTYLWVTESVVFELKWYIVQVRVRMYITLLTLANNHRQKKEKDE